MLFSLALLAACFAAQAQVPDVLGVYPARVDNGDLAFYGVVRELPGSPLADGGAIAVQITAPAAPVTTSARREANGAPCADCTATHYFRPGESETRPRLLIDPPGPVTYIHVGGKEYVLKGIRLRWSGNTPHLEQATLMRTGFVPPIFKGQIRIRFDAPLGRGARADGIAGMALADVKEAERRAREAYEAAMEAHR